jgi:3'-phosphoadenosine 5'-phosphosulfate sulfotransferase (PAPS reductase)/FAD synthetase
LKKKAGIEMRYSYAEFERLKSLPLQDKILWSEQVILNALKQSKVPSVSCSWGKDSIVLVYLVRKFCKNAYILFANTLVEYPDTYRFRDRMLKEWNLQEVYFESKPIKNFWQCVKEYGYPHNRQTASQDKEGEKSKRIPKCCIYLKEKPLQDLEKRLGVDTVFIGLQATESMNRRLLFLRLGEFYFNKTEKMNRCYPLAIWTDEDIYSFVRQENIPLSDIYKRFNRNGCMYCTGFKNWREVMARFNPKIYQKVLLEKEGQKTINCNFGT